jgi:hypothetical protein
MNKVKCVIAVVLAMFVVAGCASLGGGRKGPTCIVLPSRFAVVQFAFDMARLRQSVYLLAYDKMPETGAAVLHIWNEKDRSWVKSGVEQYVAGDVFAELPKTVVLLGTDADLPMEIAGVPGWCSEVVSIEKLDLVSMMNGFDEIYAFSAREWNWLAERYEVKYEDLNAELRRYGRYGRPGEENKAQLTPPQEKAPGPLVVPEGPFKITTEEVEAEPAEVLEETDPKAAVEPVKDVKVIAPIPPEDK